MADTTNRKLPFDKNRPSPSFLFFLHLKSKQMKKKECFVFDFDGTLADSDLLEQTTMVETVRRYFDKDFPSERIFSYYGPTEDGILRKILPQDKIEEGLSFFFDYYRQRQDDLLVPFDGIIPLLEDIKKHGKSLFLLTGRSRRTLDMSLDRMGLRDFFQSYYTGSLDGVNKTENMSTLLKEHSLDKEKVLYIGDTLADVDSMKKAGVDLLSAGYSHDVAYRWKLEEANPGNVVSTIDELKACIHCLL